MKKFKILSALLLVVSVSFSLSVTAFAQADRESVINAWFKLNCESQRVTRTYESEVGIEVPISENPFAAVEYEWVVQSVKLIDDDVFRKIYADEESSIKWLNNTYGGIYDYHGIDRGMTLLWDYGIEGYDNGVWLTAQSGNELLNADKYRRVIFIDNGDSFTLQTEDGTENLGTYKKVYGFDTDEDIGYDGDLEAYYAGGDGAGGTTGGTTGGSGLGDNNDTSYTASKNQTTVTDGNADISSNSSEIKTTVTSSSTNSVNNTTPVTGNNAPVTPEIVSAVDAAKSAKEAEYNTSVVSGVSDNVRHKTSPIWIIFLVVIVGAAGFLFGKQRATSK